LQVAEAHELLQMRAVPPADDHQFGVRDFCPHDGHRLQQHLHALLANHAPDEKDEWLIRRGETRTEHLTLRFGELELELLGADAVGNHINLIVGRVQSVHHLAAHKFAAHNHAPRLVA
jgi:hypothetical protein